MEWVFMFTNIGGYPIDIFFSLNIPDAAVPLTSMPNGPKISVYTEIVNLRPTLCIWNVAGIPIRML